MGNLLNWDLLVFDHPSLSEEEGEGEREREMGWRLTEERRRCEGLGQGKDVEGKSESDKYVCIYTIYVCCTPKKKKSINV